MPDKQIVLIQPIALCKSLTERLNLAINTYIFFFQVTSIMPFVAVGISRTGVFTAPRINVFYANEGAGCIVRGFAVAVK